MQSTANFKTSSIEFMENRIQPIHPPKFPTALMARTFSADTACQIRNEAKNPGELALADVYEKLPGIMDDFRLSGLPFDREPIEQIIIGVMLKGTQSQKNAMIKYLPIESGFAFPEMNRIFSGDINRWGTGIAFIVAQIEKLAEFMGSRVPGDVADVAERILENFGGLSPVDIIRFFIMCRDGYFRTEYQNVSVRGINAEFLMDWLNQYCEKRETVYLQMVSSVKSNSAAGDGGTEKPHELMIREKKLARLEADAQTRRMMMDAELVETAVMEYWMKPVKMEAVLDDGRKVSKIVSIPCEPDDPERVEREVMPYQKDKPGAQYKRLKFFVETFITLGEPSDEFIKKLIDGWRMEHSMIGETQIAFEDFARNESAKFVNAGKRMLEKISPGEIIRRALAEKTGEPGHSLNDAAQKVINRIHDLWMDYLEASLNHPDAYPLKKHDFMIQRALIWAKQNGSTVSLQAVLDDVLA